MLIYYELNKNIDYKSKENLHAVEETTMSENATRTILIRSMIKLMRKRHFSDITVSDICNKADVSRRSFYRHFSDKYAILEATYKECFFSKLNVNDVDTFWDIFDEICLQIDKEKAFFRHAFEVRGQNGFWDETRKILRPYMSRDFPFTEETEEMGEFFVTNNLNMLFQLLEQWIHDDCRPSPEEFSEFVRMSFAVYGKWVYEVATSRPRSEYNALNADEW